MDKRQQQLDKIRQLLKLSFDNHDKEKSFMDGISRERESTQHNVNKRESLMRDYEPFKKFAQMPLSQTKVEQAKFPELATDWGEQTVGFVKNLAAKARTLAIEKSSVEKELNASIARVRELQEQIESKQTKSVGELQKQVNELTGKNESLTTENANTKKEILSLNQKMEGLKAQIAGHEGELRTMTDMLTEKDGKLDAATNENKELGAQVKTNETLIEDQKLANDSLLKELETLKSEFAALSVTNATLLSDLETKKTVESDNDALKTQIVVMESTVLEKDADIVSIQEKMNEQIKQIENQYKMENAKAKIFHDMEKDLMKQLHDAAIEKQISEIAKNSTNSTAELTAKISALEQDHKNALEALELRNKAALSEFENTKAIVLADANVENDSLKTQNEKLEAAKLACEEAKQICDKKTLELEKANAECEKQRKQLQEANAECEKQREKLQEANAAIETELIANNARIEKINEQIAADKLTLTEKNSEQEFNHAVRITALEAEKLGIEKQNENLNEALKTLSTEHETLKTKLNDLEQTYQQSTKELLDANAAELQTLIAEHKEKISEAEKKEKESITKFAIDTCLINNSIESLKWTDWESAKGYFVGKYGNVDQIVELQSITGLSDQIKSIGESTSLDGLMGSFGMLTNILSPSSNNSSQPTSVEPTCIESLTKLTIAFLNSQKQIEDIRNEIAKKEEIKRIENEKYESLLSEQKSAVRLLKDLEDKVGILEGKIKATEGENLDLSTEKKELNNEIKELKMRLLSQNVNLNASQKEEMTKLLDEKISANITILDLNIELNKIKEELETKNNVLVIAENDAKLKKTQFDELNTNIKAQEITVSQLTGEVDAIKNANIELSKTVEKEKISNEELLQKLNGANNENNRITAELEELKKQNEKVIDDSVEAIKDEEKKSKLLQAKIDANQLELDALTNANDANKKELVKLASDKATNQAKIDELTGINQANEKQMQIMIQQINTLTGELIANKTKIETLKSKLDAQTQELALMNTQLQDLQTNKSEMETALTNLKNDNAAQKLEHEQELAKAEEDYNNALVAASKTHETNLETNLETQLAEAKAELEKKSEEAQAELARQLAQAIEKLDNQLTTETAAKAECEKKIQELQNRELKLAKELLFLKLQLDLKEQQARNYKPVYVPPSPTTTYVSSTPTFVKKDRLTTPRPKQTLLGGAKNKSKIFMKGGATEYVDYDGDTEIVVVFDKTYYSTIGQYPDPGPTNNDDYVVHCTEKEIREYNNRTLKLKAEIESLKKELENLKNSASTSTTPICAFVNKMAHGASASTSPITNAKLMKELMLMKTHISSNANKFLLERIANMTNQKIVSTLNTASKKKIADLTATIDTNKATITDMKTEIDTNKTTITDMKTEIDKLKLPVSSSSGSGGGPIGIGSGPIGIGGGSGAGAPSGPSGGSGSGPMTGSGIGAGPSGTNTLAGYVKPNIAFVPGN